MMKAYYDHFIIIFSQIILWGGVKAKLNSWFVFKIAFRKKIAHNACIGLTSLTIRETSVDLLSQVCNNYLVRPLTGKPVRKLQFDRNIQQPKEDVAPRDKLLLTSVSPFGFSSGISFYCRNSRKRPPRKFEVVVTGANRLRKCAAASDCMVKQ